MTLYRGLLGAAFDALPATAQRLHSREGGAHYEGEVDVRRGHGWLSRLCALATGLPPAGRGPIRVDIEARRGRETWTRHVAGHSMRSRLRAHDGCLREHLGAVVFDFDLRPDGAQLHWRVARVRALGLPLPARLFRDVHAREFEEAGRYRFDVHARLPGIGLLVHYAGWLHVD